MMSDDKLRLIHCFLRDNGYAETARSFEKEVGNKLAFDCDYFVAMVNDGDFDNAVEYAEAYLETRENLVALNVVFELRKQQFMEMLRDPNEESCPRKFFVEKLKPLILINRNVFKEAARGIDKTYDLIHNFSDLLIMSKDEQKDMACLRGSIRSQRRALGEVLLKVIDHESLGLTFRYGPDIKDLSLRVVHKNEQQDALRGVSTGRSSRGSTSSFKTPRRAGTARKGTKRGCPTGKVSKGSDAEMAAISGTFERVRQFRVDGSVAALAFHPKSASTIVLGTFGGYFELRNIDTGATWASGQVVKRKEKHSGSHTITKMKWDPSGACVCASGAKPLIYIISFKSGVAGDFKLHGVRQIALSMGAFDNRIILNDFAFLPSQDAKENHLICANDLHLRHQGYVDTLTKSFTEFKSLKTFAYPSEPCVSLAIMQCQGANPLQQHEGHKFMVYGITMLGDVVLFNPLGSKSVKKVFRGLLQNLIGCMPVVERWILLDPRKVTESGQNNVHRAKLSKREATPLHGNGNRNGRSSQAARKEESPHVRIFACVQELETGGGRNIVDVSVLIASDGSMKKMEGRIPNKMPFTDPASASEATDWTIAGKHAVIAGSTEVKAWALESHATKKIPLGSTRKRVDELTPDVSRVAANCDSSMICVSKANAVVAVRVS